MNLLNKLNFEIVQYFWKTNNTVPISSSDKTVLSPISNKSKICISVRYISTDYDRNIEYLGAYLTKRDFPAKPSVFTVVSL